MSVFRARSLLSYLLKGRSKYYIHSPYVYEFAEAVLADKRHFYAFDEIADLRRELSESKQEIRMEELGAGSHSKLDQSNMRKVSEVCKKMAVRARYGRLLFRLSNHFQPRNILELGTSLGIGTAYLSKGALSAQTTSIEGCSDLHQLSRENLDSIGLEQVELLKGDFDLVLPEFLKGQGELDMVFLDGNHRYEPTMRYLGWMLEHAHEGSLFVMDDIHWSREMEEAWEAAKALPQVQISIDLFQFGLLFFRTGQVKEHFRLYY